MIKIYICEDEKNQREQVKAFVKDAIAYNNLNMEIELASPSPDEILKSAYKNSSYHSLYFLDVDLKSHINGITLASKIREFDPTGFIIFITTHAEMSYLTFTYKLEAMDYIIKDNCANIKNRIKECMLVANERYSNINNDNHLTFTIKKDEKIINILYKDILFFETSPIVHKITLHAINRQIEFYGKMKEIEASLDERFFRTHRSFLVNKDNIKEIDKKNRIIHMINCQQCYGSAKNIKELL